jgi:CubicO group peptidase (beta-lactamase class C family)
MSLGRSGDLLNRVRSVALALASAFIAGCASNAPASSPGSLATAAAPSWHTRIDALAQDALDHQHLAGLSLAIARNGTVLYAQGYGYRNLAQRLPATPETIYNIASMSKQFTASCIMLLQQDGKLKVDDPIGKFLPGFPHGDEITIRELLNHTSGLTDYLDLLDANHLSMPKILAAVEKAPLRFPPGTRYEYSNSNYVLLGAIVATASGMPFDTFLTQRILVPLGLHSTSIGTTPIDMTNGALGYTVVDGHTVATPPQGVNILDYPDGGVNTTVLDLVKWDDALDSGRVVNKQLLRMMMTPGPHGPETTYRYGFGLGIDSAFGHREIAHQGEWTGYTGENVTFPDDRFVIILLSNTDGFNEEYLAREMFAAVMHPATAQLALEARSAPGENAARTRRARSVLGQLGADVLDPSDVAPSLQRQMAPQQRAALEHTLRGFGPLRRMIFVGRNSDSAGITEDYRLFYPSAVVAYWVEFSPDGRVDSVSFSRED